METKEKKKGIRYLNKYNLDLIINFWFGSGYRSIIAWLFILIGFGTYRMAGVFTVLFVGTISMIIKGIATKMWKPYGKEGNKQKDDTT